MVEDDPDTAVCPLCGGLNACSLVVSAESSEPCWCESIVVPQEVLDRIPQEARNKSCVCRECIMRYIAGAPRFESVP